MEEAIWQNLINTDWHDYRGSGRHEDQLLRPGEPEQLLERWSMQGLGIESSTPEVVRQLQELRGLLQRIVQAILHAESPAEEDLRQLNRYFEQAPAHRLLTKSAGRYQLAEVPFRADWQWVLGVVATSFASTLAERDPSRIKQCANPDCGWIFYDESGNKTRRWCEDSCANIMRVRQYRERQHHA